MVCIINVIQTSYISVNVRGVYTWKSTILSWQMQVYNFGR